MRISGIEPSSVTPHYTVIYWYRLRTVDMIELQDVEKSVLVWYKDGIMAFYTSNYLSNFLEYEHTKITYRSKNLKI